MSNILASVLLPHCSFSLHLVHSALIHVHTACAVCRPEWADKVSIVNCKWVYDCVSQWQILPAGNSCWPAPFPLFAQCVVESSHGQAEFGTDLMPHYRASQLPL